eukprot:TRINITY_DN14898_c0_g1_i2.p1 TRINITY_DN14898_c0_g1~~TRINITY_DN14898_c0_g1_i2.p1  ORF type:complete len:508 (-),score=96.58 TRINITY_DN14898_c0_g1_i2:306-1829(-)
MENRDSLRDAAEKLGIVIQLLAEDSEDGVEHLEAWASDETVISARGLLQEADAVSISQNLATLCRLCKEMPSQPARAVSAVLVRMSAGELLGQAMACVDGMELADALTELLHSVLCKYLEFLRASALMRSRSIPFYALPTDLALAVAHCLSIFLAGCSTQHSYVQHLLASAAAPRTVAVIADAASAEALVSADLNFALISTAIKERCAALCVRLANMVPSLAGESLASNPVMTQVLEVIAQKVADERTEDIEDELSILVGDAVVADARGNYARVVLVHKGNALVAPYDGSKMIQVPCKALISDQAGPSSLSLEECYEALELAPSATKVEVSRAFRRLAKLKHPDKGGDEAEFRRIREAFEILGSVLTQTRDVERAHPETPPPKRRGAASSSSATAAAAPSGCKAASRRSPRLRTPQQKKAEAADEGAEATWSPRQATTPPKATARACRQRQSAQGRRTGQDLEAYPVEVPKPRRCCSERTAPAQAQARGSCCNGTCGDTQEAASQTV